jgi:hypothetical protein
MIRSLILLRLFFRIKDVFAFKEMTIISIFKSTQFAIDDQPSTQPVELCQSKHPFFQDLIGVLIAIDSSASLLPSQFYSASSLQQADAPAPS